MGSSASKPPEGAKRTNCCTVTDALAAARRLPPLEDLIRILDKEDTAESVEFAIDDVRAWALTKEGAAQAIKAGGLRVIRDTILKGRFHTDELVARTALRCLSQFCQDATSVKKMQRLGMLEELEGAFITRWSTEFDIVSATHVVVTRARRLLAELVASSMDVPMRLLSLSKVLRVLSDNLFCQSVVVSALNALRRISLTVTALDLLDPECAALLEELNRIPEIYAADDKVIMYLADAVCDIAANSYDGGHRTMLASTGMISCWLQYLSTGLDRNFGAMTMQLALFVLSELCRDHEANVILLFTHPTLLAVDILNSVQQRAKEGAFSEPVVLPLVLRSALRNHKQIMMRTRDMREDLRDLKVWEQEHYGEKHNLDHCEARRVAFRPTGMFSAESAAAPRTLQPATGDYQQQQQQQQQIEAFFEDAKAAVSS